MRNKISLSILCLTLAACAATPTSTSNSATYSAMTTSALWATQAQTQSPLELAFVEAELGARGETVSGQDYLGKRTASALGRQLYSRTGGAGGGQDCSDFSSTGEAQRFFLANGGPLSDPSNLDGDGDGLACEWGIGISAIAKRNAPRPAPVVRRYSSSSQCYTGPRGGTYTITSGGSKNYGGC